MKKVNVFGKDISLKSYVLLWVGIILIFSSLFITASVVDCVKCWSYDTISNKLNVNYTSRFLKCNASEQQREHDLRVFIANQTTTNIMSGYNFSVVR